MREIRCRKCRSHKGIEHFSTYDNGFGKRLRHTCRECRNEYQKTLRANDGKAPEKVVASTKRCSACDLEKRLEDFSTNGQTRLHSHCRDCQREKARRWWAQHGQVRGKGQALKFNYGISMEQYNEILATQGGVCAICGKAEEARNYRHNGRNQKRRSLCVDHSHDGTDRIRGILCATCNNGLGCFKDNTELLQLAISYLEKHSS